MQLNRHVENSRVPSCWVLFAPAIGNEVYGPFETEDQAALWAAERMPERVLFTVLPVFAMLPV